MLMDSEFELKLWSKQTNCWGCLFISCYMLYIALKTVVVYTIRATQHANIAKGLDGFFEKG